MLIFVHRFARWQMIWSQPSSKSLARPPNPRVRAPARVTGGSDIAEIAIMTIRFDLTKNPMETLDSSPRMPLTETKPHSVVAFRGSRIASHCIASHSAILTYPTQHAFYRASVSDARTWMANPRPRTKRRSSSQRRALSSIEKPELSEVLRLFRVQCYA